jgi:hypothetical protein
VIRVAPASASSRVPNNAPAALWLLLPAALLAIAAVATVVFEPKPNPGRVGAKPDAPAK